MKYTWLRISLRLNCFIVFPPLNYTIESDGMALDREFGCFKALVDSVALISGLDLITVTNTESFDHSK